MISIPTITLPNGINMPSIGFGTWPSKGEECQNAVSEALACGFRLIDTAAQYYNEDAVGAAIVSAGLPRNEIFLTSKLPNWARGYDESMEAFQNSLEQLQTDYLDLYLMHWPNPLKFRENGDALMLESWQAMVDLYKAGKVRAIGVSNFWIRHLKLLEENAEIMPLVNQMRHTPGEVKQDVVDYCRENNIQLEAYSPFGSGDIFQQDSVKNIGIKYGKSPAQVTLRWIIDQGIVPIPRTIIRSEMDQDIDVFDFSLDQTSIDFLDHLDYGREFRDPDTMPI